MNGDLFVAYVRTILVPTLQPGQIVVMDNWSSHKRVEVRSLIEAAGCELWFLPKYSPDLNPIEMCFAKLKSLLRQAEKRTLNDLRQFVFEATRSVSPDECENMIRHSGYKVAPAT